MNDSVLQRYSGRRFDPRDALADDSDSADDLGAFGWLRGMRDRSIMLEFRTKDGSAEAFPYAWLERATFNPSEGITLRFSGQAIKIIGRHLNAEVRSAVRLFDGILRQKVPWIREADHTAMLRAAPAVVVVEQVRFDR